MRKPSKTNYAPHLGLAVPRYLFDYDGEEYYAVIVYIHEDGRYHLVIGNSEEIWTMQDVPEVIRTPLLLTKAKYAAEEPLGSLSWSRYKEALINLDSAVNYMRVVMNGKPMTGIRLLPGMYMVTVTGQDIQPFVDKYIKDLE